jgi:hypothetical protein
MECQFKDCDKPHRARGMCQGHYKQWERGKELTPLRMSVYLRGGGPNHPNWTGDEVGYIAAHDRLRRLYGQVRNWPCVDCNSRPSAHYSYDGNCPREKVEIRGGVALRFSTNVSRYSPRCGSCHQRLNAGRRQLTSV